MPLVLFVSGLGLVAASIATGEAELSLLVVFPVVSGSGVLFLLGAILMIASFLTWFLWLATTGHTPVHLDGGTAASRESTGGGTKYGGVVLIGPVPIAFGSTRRMALAMLAVGIVTAVALLGLMFLLG